MGYPVAIVVFTLYALHPTLISIFKIAVSFPSLILSLILPRDDREKTERTPHQLRVTKKALFLRIIFRYLFRQRCYAAVLFSPITS